MTERELAIIKAALEGDIIHQRQSDKKEHPAFKAWLQDTETLLQKVNNRIWTKKANEMNQKR